jgi:hypothetical protein
MSFVLGNLLVENGLSVARASADRTLVRRAALFNILLAAGRTAEVMMGRVGHDGSGRGVDGLTMGCQRSRGFVDIHGVDRER